MPWDPRCTSACAFGSDCQVAHSPHRHFLKLRKLRLGSSAWLLASKKCELAVTRSKEQTGRTFRMYEEGLAEKIATLKLQLAARNELRYPKKPLTNPAHSRSESEMYEDMDDGPPRWVSELSKMDGEGDGKRTEMPTIAGAAPSGDVQESFGQLRAKVTAMEQQLFGRAAAALRARVSPMTEESISAMQSRRAFLEAQVHFAASSPALAAHLPVHSRWRCSLLTNLLCADRDQPTETGVQEVHELLP